MVSLRRRTTSGDIKKIFAKPLGLTKSNDRPRIQSDSAAGVDKQEKISTKSSSLKITDLKDFHKLSPSSAVASGAPGAGATSNSSSVNSIPKEISPDDPFDHDNIGYLNGSGQSNSSSNANNNTANLICERLPGKNLTPQFPRTHSLQQYNPG